MLIFGVSNTVDVYSFVGTPPYMAPERLGDHKGWQLKKADVWAIAAIAYEMATGKRCFQGTNQREVFGNIMRGQWSWPQNGTPSVSMQDFIQKCLNLDTSERLSAEEALRHPWFTEMSHVEG